MAEAAGSERRPLVAEHSRAEGRLLSKAAALPRNPRERPKNKQGSLELCQGIMELFEAEGSSAVLFIQEGKSCLQWDCRRSSSSSAELEHSDSHEKSAHLDWEGPAADAQCLGFQHTQQKSLEPEEKGTDLDGGSKPALPSGRTTMRGNHGEGKMGGRSHPYPREGSTDVARPKPRCMDNVYIYVLYA